METCQLAVHSGSCLVEITVRLCQMQACVSAVWLNRHYLRSVYIIVCLSLSPFLIVFNSALICLVLSPLHLFYIFF
jgi:hypothetical protein